MIAKRDQNTCRSSFLQELLTRLAGEERGAGIRKRSGEKKEERGEQRELPGVKLKKILIQK